MSGTPIAIIEDNLDLLDDLVFNLAHRGFAPDGFDSGEAFDAALSAGCPWLVLILDLGLPGEDGLSIARRLRNSQPGLGIVMLTARGKLEDRIQGLADGADSYLCKPVDMDELAMTVRAVMRRVAPIQGAAGTDIWTLDIAGYCLVRPDGRRIPLGYADLLIIKTLAAASGMPVDRDQLVVAIGKDPDVYDMRAMEMTMSRLRKKLGEDSPITAARGKGYVFSARIVTV